MKKFCFMILMVICLIPCNIYAQDMQIDSFKYLYRDMRDENFAVIGCFGMAYIFAHNQLTPVIDPTTKEPMTSNEYIDKYGLGIFYRYTNDKNEIQKIQNHSLRVEFSVSDGISDDMGLKYSWCYMVVGKPIRLTPDGLVILNINSVKLVDSKMYTTN